MFEPSGIRHEVRVALRGAGGTWGVLILMRGGADPDFSPPEIGLLASLGPTVAEGLRRAAVLGDAPPAGTDGPGLVLCTVTSVHGTADVRIDHATGSARHWLSTIDDGANGELPYAIASLVHSRNEAPVHGPWRARIRTRTGGWITAHAERLGPTMVSVIIEPTRSHELRADAYRLTGREREVAALAVRGLTNPQIAEALFLSPYTVQDHLKQIFSKTGATGRTELASRLFIDPEFSAHPPLRQPGLRRSEQRRRMAQNGASSSSAIAGRRAKGSRGAALI